MPNYACPVYRTIPEDVLDVLSQAVTSDTAVQLQGELERSLYERVDKFLKLMGLKWKANKGVHEAPKDKNAAELLNAALETKQVLDEKQSRQAFYTPEEVCEYFEWGLEEYSDQTIKGSVVLDTSCGGGAILAYAKKLGAERLIGIEIDKNAAQTCHENLPEAYIHCADLMKFELDGTVDMVLMNPPYSRGQLLRHIQKSMLFLKEEGDLCTIAPYPLDHKVKAALEEDFLHVATLKLPLESFKKSGTQIDTCIVIAHGYKSEPRLQNVPISRSEVQQPKVYYNHVKTIWYPDAKITDIVLNPHRVSSLDPGKVNQYKGDYLRVIGIGAFRCSVPDWIPYENLTLNPQEGGGALLTGCSSGTHHESWLTIDPDFDINDLHYAPMIHPGQELPPHPNQHGSDLFPRPVMGNLAVDDGIWVQRSYRKVYDENGVPTGARKMESECLFGEELGMIVEQDSDDKVWVKAYGCLDTIRQIWGDRYQDHHLYRVKKTGMIANNDLGYTLLAPAYTLTSRKVISEREAELLSEPTIESEGD